MQPFHLFRSLTSLTAELMWKHILSRKIIPYMLFVMSESKIHAQNKALVYSFLKFFTYTLYFISDMNVYIIQMIKFKSRRIS